VLLLFVGCTFCTLQVLVNVVGALSELAKDQTNRLSLRKGNGIAPLIALLTGTNAALLINVTRAVGQCAREPDNMAYASINIFYPPCSQGCPSPKHEDTETPPAWLALTYDLGLHFSCLIYCSVYMRVLLECHNNDMSDFTCITFAAA